MNDRRYPDWMDERSRVMRDMVDNLAIAQGYPIEAWQKLRKGKPDLKLVRSAS